MPSFLSDAAASPVFWVALVVILLLAVGGYMFLQRRVDLFTPPTTDNSKILQDWIPTGRIDFAGPSLDPSAADTPATFYLQAEDVRLLISMSGIERREIRWRKATFNEAKRIVSVFHRQLPKSSFRALEKESLPDSAPTWEPLTETPPAKERPPEAAEEAVKDSVQESVAEPVQEPPHHADAASEESEATEGEATEDAGTHAGDESNADAEATRRR